MSEVGIGVGETGETRFQGQAQGQTVMQMQTQMSSVTPVIFATCSAILITLLLRRSIPPQSSSPSSKSVPDKVPVGIGVVAMRDGFVLVGRRKSKQGHNQWALPGGWLEPHETFEECALRELEEETGFSRRDGEVVSGSARMMKEIEPSHNGFSVSLFVKVDLKPGSTKAAILMEPDKCFEWRFLPLTTSSSSSSSSWPSTVRENLFPSLKHFLEEQSRRR